MIVKRYLANSMPQAMEQIKRDLGPEAVILSTRTVPSSGWRRFLGQKQLEVTAALEQLQQAKDQNIVLREEIQELGKMVRELKNSSLEAGANLKPSRGWQGLFDQIGINNELSENLLNGLGEPGGGGEKEALTNQIIKFLRGRTRQVDSRIHCFVGPTGVGKTTTLAKLATKAAIFQERKTVMITADTYRIGAIEQLRIYAEILNIDLEVILTPEELAEVLARHRDKEAVFIDTAGRPSYNREQLWELKQLLEIIPEKTVSLVLSCTTKNEDLLKVVDDFKITNYDQLIFTKTDETNSLGSILNLLNITECPVAYITTGQNVPEDILEAKPEKVANLVLGAKRW